MKYNSFHFHINWKKINFVTCRNALNEMRKEKWNEVRMYGESSCTRINSEYFPICFSSYNFLVNISLFYQQICAIMFFKDLKDRHLKADAKNWKLRMERSLRRRWCLTPILCILDCIYYLLENSYFIEYKLIFISLNTNWYLFNWTQIDFISWNTNWCLKC